MSIQSSDGETGKREAKFAWYYMTTTLTTTSFSTSTSTRYTCKIILLFKNTQILLIQILKCSKEKIQPIGKVEGIF